MGPLGQLTAGAPSAAGAECGQFAWRPRAAIPATAEMVFPVGPGRAERRGSGAHPVRLPRAPGAPESLSAGSLPPARRVENPGAGITLRRASRPVDGGRAQRCRRATWLVRLEATGGDSRRQRKLFFHVGHFAPGAASARGAVCAQFAWWLVGGDSRRGRWLFVSMSASQLAPGPASAAGAECGQFARCPAAGDSRRQWK